ELLEVIGKVAAPELDDRDRLTRDVARRKDVDVRERARVEPGASRGLRHAARGTLVDRILLLHHLSLVEPENADDAAAERWRTAPRPSPPPVRASPRGKATRPPVDGALALRRLARAEFRARSMACGVRHAAEPGEHGPHALQDRTSGA